MKLARIVVLLTGIAGIPLTAQVLDSAGNGKLNGTYYFRQLVFTSAGEAAAIYGNLNFSGTGTYTVSGAQAIYCYQCYYVQATSYSQSGTYTISASGYGSILSPLTGQPVYGLTGANGVFIGSSTETDMNDLFIAAPVSGQNSGTFQGSYSLAYLDPFGALAQVPFDALLQMSPNGSGIIGTVNVSLYATSSTPTTGSYSNVKYIVSNNAFKVTFPNTSNGVFAGDYYLYSTPDGSFVFGGSPGYFDMIVGVRTGSSGSGFGGWYYEGGMIVDNSTVASTGSSSLYSYYGSLNAGNGAIIGHQRIQDGSGTAQGNTYTESYPTGTAGSYNNANTGTQYVGGSGGAVRIGLGMGPYPSISVAVQAPAFSGSGVYLNPIGVVNAASYAPFTAGVARGELLVLQGTNLGPGTLQVASTIPLPTTLGGVQVLVNGKPAPIYYVSSTQISAVVPWSTTSSVAQFQVVNSGVNSNAVTEFVYTTTPGVFTNPANGTGYAAAIHQDGVSLVSPANPAQPGETISVYLTGLGDVSPGIADGAAGPAPNYATTSNTITAHVGGAQATVTYSGLAPGLVALYQINLTIPTGVSAGDTDLDISGPDSYTSESLISIGGAASSTAVSAGPARLMRIPRTGNAVARPLVRGGLRPLSGGAVN
jgi:uncharacterized protein (TIGR03437 family)